MPAANISINAVDGSNTDLPINVLVQLNNQNIGGESTFNWTILDQPPGTVDVLSSSTIQNPTFTPKKEGTYLIKLVVNQSQTTEQIDTVVAAVRQLKTRERVPAAGETTQADTADGWATAANSLLRLLDTARADPGIYVGVAGASLNRGDVVRVTGTSTIKSGLPGQEFLPTVNKALATLATNLDELLGVVEGDVTGAVSVVASGLARVRVFGLFRQLTGVPTTGNPVFVSDLGAVAVVQGTVRRIIGTGINPSGGTYDVMVDGGQTFEASSSIEVQEEGVAVGTRSKINFIGAASTAVDNPGSSRVDVTFTAASVGASVAGAIAVGDAAAAGASAEASRVDHRHALPAPAAPADVTKAAASAGAATTVARADHKHDVSTAAAGTITGTNAEGAATSLARSNHDHAYGAGSVSSTALSIVDGNGLAPMEVIRKAFTAGGGGSPDDVTIYSTNAPFGFRIIDAFVYVSTFVALSTLTLRTATGGGGAAVSDAFPSTAVGVQRNVFLTLTSTIATNGTLVLRRSDNGVAGEVVVLIQKV